jgi:hypothetical protein
MIRKGDRVNIKPQWQDEGDKGFIWVALNDEEKGRVDITPTGPSWEAWRFPPSYCAKVEWLENMGSAMPEFHPEFSDYPLADLPAMPEGFSDSSWHNDVCPSYRSETLGLQIFMDYVDKSLSESAMGTRFSIHRDMPDGSSDVVFQSDDWADIVEFVEGEKTRAPMRILYTSDGEVSGVMTLNELVRNFDSSSAWYGPNGEGVRYADKMQRHLRERGWFTGHHDCGDYLVVNIDLFHLEYRDPAMDA